MPASTRLGRQPHHRLKQLRAICGFTQQTLAERIGVTLSTIVAVETGTLKMSRRLATQVMLVSGVDPDSLMDGPELQTLAPGVRFNAEMYAVSRELLDTSTPGEPVTMWVQTTYEGAVARDEKIQAQIDRISGDFRLMALASVKSNQFYVFKYLFHAWHNEMLNTLKLGDPINALMKESDLKGRMTIQSTLKTRGVAREAKKRPIKPRK